MLAVGGDGIGQLGCSSGRDRILGKLQAQARAHILEFDIERLLAEVRDYDLPALLLPLRHVSTLDVNRLEREVAETYRVHLLEGELLGVAFTAEPEYDRLLEA